jgi:hypothetical protein
MKTVRHSAIRGRLVPACYLAICCLAGCSGIEPAERERPPRARAVIPPPSVTGVADCFLVIQAQDFRVLDRSNLIVYAPDERHAYHVQIAPPSLDLRDAESLAFRASSGRICGFAGERLIIGGNPGRPAGQEISVIAVSRLSGEGLELLRGRNAAAPPVAPRPGPGPEIEGAPVPESPPDPASRADTEAEK